MKKADTDVDRLSMDGIAAYRDVHLARLAIFDAKPDQARMFVSHAQSALDKAKTDETAFTKAEADLKPPAGMGTAATMAGTDGAKTGDSGKDMTKDSTAKTSASGEPVKWLPSMRSSCSRTTSWSATRTSRNPSTRRISTSRRGRKGAMERLKLAGVDVDFTMAVVPLDKTTQEVNHAAPAHPGRQVLRGERDPEDGRGRGALRRGRHHRRARKAAAAKTGRVSPMPARPRPAPPSRPAA